MVDVFISYSRHDEAKVAQLARMVEAEGYKVWWDADLPPHQSYGDVITAKIISARAAIVVWSAASVQSEWVRAEADMARGQKKLIQTSLDAVMPPLPFNQIQFAAIGDWQGEPDHTGWRKVKASLAELCGPREAGDAVPVRAAPAYVAPPAPVYAQAPPSRWPLYAGLGVGLLGIAVAAGMFFGKTNTEEVMRAPELAQPEPEAASVGQTAGQAQSAPAQTGAYNLDATVEDPDGYSNVRSGPGTNSAILARVQTGERFATYQQSGNWWQVRLGNGTEGYIARRLIRLPGEARQEAGQETGQSDDFAASAADMTFADSSTRLLTPADLAALGPATLQIARNEIYARKGRRFREPRMREYFSSFRWYNPRFDEVELNAIEKSNIALIAQAEQRYGG